MEKLKKIINLKQNKLIYIGGRPSTGKTTMMLNIAKDVAVNDKIPVVVFSLEMGIEACTNKIIGNSNINEVSELNIFIDDTPAVSVDTIKEKCIKLKNDKNIGLVIIDYLQLIRSNENEDVYNLIQKLAQELNVPIIIMSQLKREIDEREDKRPKLSDIDNIIEKSSDVIIFLYNEKENREIIVAKNKNGEIGTI